MSSANHTIPELDRQGLRSFGLTTAAIIAVLFGLFFPWLLELGFILWPWGLFALLASVALIAPGMLGPVYKIWMRFGLLMSNITTPLIMGIVFYLVIFPSALIMRILGRDPMMRTLDTRQASYRVATKKPSRESLERPF
jgi:saxitoxin biosynthesis operon SxtJ-like protein